MKILRITSEDILVEPLLALVAQQWAALGVAVRANEPPAAVLDLEALLWCTLEVGRYESRLFDEVVDWIELNHRHILVPRLRQIGPAEEDVRWRILCAIARRLQRGAVGRPWGSLADTCRREIAAGEKTEGLFLGEAGVPPEAVRVRDPDFAACGLIRSAFETRGLSAAPGLHLPAAAVLRAKAVFGADARAYVWVALLTREGDLQSGISERTGYGEVVGRILKGLVESGICRVEQRQTAKWYALVDREAWRDVFQLSEFIPPWPNWIRLFRGLVRLLRTWAKCREAGASEYLFASELRKAFVEAREDIAGGGIAVASPSPELYLVDEFPRRFEAYLGELFSKSLFLD